MQYPLSKSYDERPHNGLPGFKDLTSLCHGTGRFLICQECGNRLFYRLAQTLIIGESYEGVYICRYCGTFHTVDLTMAFDKIEVVDQQTWKSVDIEWVDRQFRYID